MCCLHRTSYRWYPFCSGLSGNFNFVPTSAPDMVQSGIQLILGSHSFIMSMADTSVIYEGNKFFWRKRVTIDVVIVEHNDFDITEVITYEPTIDREASRIYLDSEILSSKINQEGVAKKMSFAERSDVPHTIQFVNGVLNRAVADYILNHLSLKKFSVDPKCFSVELLFNFRDSDVESGGVNIERLICEKPPDLSPHQVLNFKAALAEETDAAIAAFEEEKRILVNNFFTAEEIEGTIRDPLSIQERWRIPIVLAKVAKNTPLSYSDAFIWSNVSSNLPAHQNASDTMPKTTPRIANRSTSQQPPQKITKPPIPTGRDRAPLHHIAPVFPNHIPCTTLRRPDDPMRYMAGTTTSQLRSRDTSLKHRKSILIVSSASTDLEDAEVSGITNTSFRGSDDSLVGHLHDSEGDLSQLVGNDPSEITPPRRRHYYFSSLLASFDSNSSSKSNDKTTSPLQQKPTAAHPLSLDAHGQPLSPDVSTNSTRTTPGNTSISASAKYHPNASGKSLVSFRDALGDWLRWSNSPSGKSSRVSPTTSLSEWGT